MEEEEKILLLDIIEKLKKSKISKLTWNQYKWFIDLQYKEEIEKVTLTENKDNLQSQLDNTCFYTIGSTDWNLSKGIWYFFPSWITVKNINDSE